MAVIIVQGPPGAGTYEYSSEGEELASHVINHNLGFKPNIQTFVYGTEEPIVGVPIHHSINQVEIVFNSPQAIVARLS